MCLRLSSKISLLNAIPYPMGGISLAQEHLKRCFSPVFISLDYLRTTLPLQRVVMDANGLEISRGMRGLLPIC